MVFARIKPLFFQWIFLLCLLCSFVGNAQTEESGKKPKIGLVLSGGGAKGFAHIGFLKAMEEAGVRPDYITGTSMGSVVGALYALGYSPKQMEEIMREVDWEETLSNKVPLNRIAFEEKNYYSRYLLVLPLTKQGPKIPTGAIEGQNLYMLLARLFEPAHNIRNFQQFPIPFKCVAADIETGLPVVLDSGDIVSALRASMAIPTVFSAVEWDGKLLVDGGLVRNFPVPEVLEMGADIVIGVNVAGGFRNKANLQSATDILQQVVFVSSIFDLEQQKEKTDLLVDMGKALSRYTAASFSAADTILAIGYAAGKGAYPQMRALADSVYGKDALTEVNQGVILDSAYRFSQINTSGNTFYPEKFISGRMRMEEDSLYAFRTLQERINLTYGTQYFTKVSYRISQDSNQQNLNLIVREAHRTEIKTALHYDSENNVGLTLNFTTRNTLLKSSRFILEADFSDNPRFQASYFKYSGKKQNAGVKLDAQFTRFRNFNLNNKGKRMATYQYQHFESGLYLQSTYLANTAFGGGIRLQYVRLLPLVTPVAFDFSTREYSTDLIVFFKHNSTDKVYFPEKGQVFEIEALHKARADVRTNGSDFYSDLTGLIDRNFSLFTNYNRLKVSFDKYQKLTNRSNLNYGFLVGVHSQASGILFTDLFRLGGVHPIVHESYSFMGLPIFGENLLDVSELHASLRYNFFRKWFVCAKANYLNTRIMAEVFNSNNARLLSFNRYDLLGVGATLNYMAAFGPITFGVHRNFETPIYYSYFGLGFNF